MALPKAVRLFEEGPREGFQIEKGPIPTDRKIALIDALSATGLTRIQTASFVHPKLVPGMADAEAVVAGIAMRPGVTCTGLWLNDRGMERAIATGRLAMIGRISTYASDAFMQRNQNTTYDAHMKAQGDMLDAYRERAISVEGAFVSAAFGCNFEGDIPLPKLMRVVRDLFALFSEHDTAIGTLWLADTMGWANPGQVRRTVGAVREAFPDTAIGLHLHDTRGLGIANAFAGLETGVADFEASVAGLGGCPFAGNPGAAGNIATEDFVFLCHELGIETGVDLDALIDCARMAETIVGRTLPGRIMHAGRLNRA